MKQDFFIKKSYKPNLVSELKKDNEDHYWTDYRIQQSYYPRYYLYKFCRKLLKKQDLKSVLDIGCGSAIKLMKFLFPVCNIIYGIDQQRIINYCRKMYKLETFYVDDIENSSINLEKKFDLIISCDVIEHLNDPTNLISYIKKYCHENTYMIITTPERDILRGKDCQISPKPSHVREWNLKEFNEFFKNNGFLILYQGLIENFRLILNFNNKLSFLIKDFLNLIAKVHKFDNLKKIKHTQILICKIKNSKKSEEKSLREFIKKNLHNNLRDYLNRFLIRTYLILYKFIDIYNNKQILIEFENFRSINNLRMT